MTNSEKLKAYIGQIAAHSRSFQDQTICRQLIRAARDFVGIDAGNICKGIYFEDLITLILLDVEGQINTFDWAGADRNFKIFDIITQDKKVTAETFFNKWYMQTEMHFRL